MLPQLGGGPARRVEEGCHVEDAADPAPVAMISVPILEHGMELVLLQEAHHRPHTHTDPGTQHTDEATVSRVVGVMVRGVDGLAVGGVGGLGIAVGMILGYVEVGLGWGVLDTRIESQHEELERPGDDLVQGERDLVRPGGRHRLLCRPGASHHGEECAAGRAHDVALPCLYGRDECAYVENQAAEHEGHEGGAVPLGKTLGEDAQDRDDRECRAPAGVDPLGQGERKGDAEPETEAQLEQAIVEAREGQGLGLVRCPDGEVGARDCAHGDRDPGKPLPDGERCDAYKDGNGLACEQLCADVEYIQRRRLDHHRDEPPPLAEQGRAFMCSARVVYKRLACFPIKEASCRELESSLFTEHGRGEAAGGAFFTNGGENSGVEHEQTRRRGGVRHRNGADCGVQAGFHPTRSPRPPLRDC